MSESSPDMPQSLATEGRSATVRRDFLASVVVFLVALPLCMGIAIASGVPVAAGLITGIVGGLIVGVISGCPLQVSGPAAGLSVLMYDIVQRFGLETIGVVVLIAGALQSVAGLLRWGQWFRAVSPAVINGMLAGIGVLIFSSQFHVMVDDAPKGSGIANLTSIPSAIMKGIGFPNLREEEQRALQIDLLKEVGELHRQQVNLQERLAERVPEVTGDAPESSLQIPAEQAAALHIPDLIARQEQIAKDLEAIAVRVETAGTQAEDTDKAKLIRETASQAEAACQCMRAETVSVPEALKAQSVSVTSLASLLGTFKNHNLAAELGILTIATIVLWQALRPKKLSFVPAPLVAVVLTTAIAAVWTLPVLYVEVPTNLLDEIRFPTMAVLQRTHWVEFLEMGAFIAIVASAETLLSAAAVDQLHQGPRAKYDRELFAQGIGNMICGFLGALPMTGVIVRSSANVNAGARTRLSAVLHGAWLLIFVAGLAALLRMIPTSCLAGILVYTGYKLMDLKSIKKLLKYGWGEVAIYFATVVMIVATDLLTGVLVGVGLATFKLLYTFSHLRVRLESDAGRKRSELQLEGAATFIKLPKLARTLEQVPEGYELHVRFESLNYIDHACLDLLMSWAKQHESTGGRLVVDWESLHANFRGERRKKPRDLTKVA